MKKDKLILLTLAAGIIFLILLILSPGCAPRFAGLHPTDIYASEEADKAWKDGGPYVCGWDLDTGVFACQTILEYKLSRVKPEGK